MMSFILGGASAFAGWVLQTITAKNYFDFSKWHLFFYIMAVLIVLAGIIDFIRCIVIVCRRAGRSGGKAGIKNLPKQGADIDRKSNLFRRLHGRIL